MAAVSNVDDPAIRRFIRFAARRVAGGLDVVNLFAWRATDPAALHTVPHPVGGRGDQFTCMTCSNGPDRGCRIGRAGLLPAARS